VDEKQLRELHIKLRNPVTPPRLDCQAPREQRRSLFTPGRQFAKAAGAFVALKSGAACAVNLEIQMVFSLNSRMASG
jgi:hypothetical protein